MPTDSVSRPATLRGALPFKEGEVLPQRAREVGELATLVASDEFRFGVLWGESGCGKTSLLRAGLVPALRAQGFLPLYISTPTQPQDSIRAALQRELVDLAARRAQGQQGDVYALYETGLDQLFKRLDKQDPVFADALPFQQRLYENIANARRYGDTELLRAGRAEIIDRLNGITFAAWRISFMELCKGSPTAAQIDTDQDLTGMFREVAPADKKAVVILDQFEQFFLAGGAPGVRESFVKWLGEAVADTGLPVAFLLSIRGSALSKVRTLAPQIPEPTAPQATYQLLDFDPPQAKAFLLDAAQTDAISFESALVDAVLRDVEREGLISPAELQMAATRLKRRNISRLDHYVAPLFPRVLLLLFNPIVDPATDERLIDRFGWSDPDELVQGYIEDLQECSDGLVNYRIVERNQFVGREELDEFPVQQDGSRLDAKQLFSALKGQKQLAYTMLDYGALIEDYNLLERVGKREFDEVWLFGFPYSGLWESTMAGKGAFFCNSPPVPKTDECPRRFMIQGFNYERGIGEMLEDLGHRAEFILAQVFGAQEYLAWGRNPIRERPRFDVDKLIRTNLFVRYITFDQIAPGKANVGTIHWAPNSQRDYDWGNGTPVRSFCDDWYQFPNMTGAVRKVDATEWGGGDIRLHHKWWFSHLPRALGETNGVSNNWWKYIVDVNNVK